MNTNKQLNKGNKMKKVIGALIALTIVSAAVMTKANALTCYSYPVSYTMSKIVCN
jgi:hypothetical protein|tara:strand:- start:87 stop:251 length:165 start_codon:yes stop_codon:yes gene_type:complete